MKQRGTVVDYFILSTIWEYRVVNNYKIKKLGCVSMNSIVNKIMDSVTDVVEIDRKDISELGLNKAIGNALFNVSHLEEAKTFDIEVIEETEGYMLTFDNGEKLYIQEDYCLEETIGLGIYDELQGNIILEIRGFAQALHPRKANPRKR